MPPIRGDRQTKIGDACPQSFSFVIRKGISARFVGGGKKARKPSRDI